MKFKSYRSKQIFLYACQWFEPGHEKHDPSSMGKNKGQVISLGSIAVDDSKTIYAINVGARKFASIESGDYIVKVPNSYRVFDKKVFEQRYTLE